VIAGTLFDLATDLTTAISSLCPSDCNANGVPDACELAMGTERDCDPLVSSCCAAHASPGCDIPAVADCVCGLNPSPIPGFFPPSCCALGHTWRDECSRLARDYCDLDEGCPQCSSGVLDTCEFGDDCDRDGVDDATAIALGSAPDCNANLVPDGCDLAFGTGRDCTRPVSNCCVAHPGAGCDIPAVASCVCNLDPNLVPGFPLASCCEVEWVETCSQLAQFQPFNCGLLCDGSPNGVLDECEISADCDLDGISDAVAIANESAADCDRNCIPDACDQIGRASCRERV